MNKQFWQCPDCGGILRKGLSVSPVKAIFIGNAICSYCHSSQDQNSVYGGKYDFHDSDDFISRMAQDSSNAIFDQSKRRWYYKGNPVLLQSDRYDRLQSPTVMKKWWQFWK